MKTILMFIAAIALVGISPLNAKGGGSTDKVTGDFTQGNCWDCQPGDELGWVAHRLISAHEATGKHRQRGFLLSWYDNGTWFEMDFDDTKNTCVNVYADGQTRIGGLVSDGQNATGGPASQIGRYFGVFLVDGGEPAYFIDHGAVFRFSSEKWSNDARAQFLDWCDSGELPQEQDRLEGFVVWPNAVFQGNLQIHNSPKDGD